MAPERIDLNATVSAWADIVVMNWREKIKQMGIFHSWTLYDSFDLYPIKILTNASGNPSSVIFGFLVYGRFIDMGVGRGVKIADVKMLQVERKHFNRHLQKNRRFPRKWFSSEFYRQRKQLERILEEKYGLKAQSVLVENLDDRFNLYYV